MFGKMKGTAALFYRHIQLDCYKSKLGEQHVHITQFTL